MKMGCASSHLQDIPPPRPSAEMKTQAQVQATVKGKARMNLEKAKVEAATGSDPSPAADASPNSPATTSWRKSVADDLCKDEADPSNLHTVPKRSVIPHPASSSSTYLIVPTDLVTPFLRASLPPPIPEPKVTKRNPASALLDMIWLRGSTWRAAMAARARREKEMLLTAESQVVEGQSRTKEHKKLELPLDVIRRICVMAQNPLPKMRSDGGFIVPAYGDEVKRPVKMHQTLLAVLMRVNKHCYDTAGALLYCEIVTDDLPALLSYTASARPPAAGMLSKVDMLKKTRHLHIEMPSELLPYQYCQYPSLLQVVRDEDMRYSVTCRIRMTQFLKAMESFVIRGGLAGFFPMLESFSTSAYTMPKGVSAFDGQREMGLALAAPERWASAWTALYSTCPAPFVCEQQHHLAPFQQNGIGALLYRDVNRSVIRQGIERPVDVTTFIHVHGLPVPGQMWRIGLRHKTVYLYTHDGSQPPIQPKVLLGAFHWLATLMIATMRAERQARPSMFMDIELRIPCAALPIFYGFTCPAAMDVLIENVLEDIHKLYASLHDRRGRELDKWKIVVVDGAAECPACCCRYDPDTDEMTKLERALSSMDLATLWPE